MCKQESITTAQCVSLVNIYVIIIETMNIDLIRIVVFWDNGERGGRGLASYLLLWEPIDI